jgi:hypothetical protein
MIARKEQRLKRAIQAVLLSGCRPVARGGLGSHFHFYCLCFPAPQVDRNLLFSGWRENRKKEQPVAGV